ncbi:CD82 antigen [Heterocephalus glaber]|uniref:CD82 antigen n=2 Tax=Hystricomorpha TaxID=33550 RepID=G5AS47_HETGA|nr:CD82 antigen [Heterocephalus glaber]
MQGDSGRRPAAPTPVTAQPSVPNSASLLDLPSEEPLWKTLRCPSRDRASATRRKPLTNVCPGVQDEGDWLEEGSPGGGSSRPSSMGEACIKVTKYFLFLFNLLFFILGAVILGFGVWILADRSSFINVLQTSYSSLQVGAYVFIAVGAVTMVMGFLGCIGAIKEVRCLLGLYFAFLLLILIAQVVAGTLFYFNVGKYFAFLLLILIAQVVAGTLFYFNVGKLKEEMGTVVSDVIRNYNASSRDSLQEAWDYIQAQVRCCGWVSFSNWTDNAALMNRSEVTYPCSCEVKGDGDTSFSEITGFCSPQNVTQDGNDPEKWPVYKEGCREKVQAWLQENLGVILGVCVGVAAIELLGMFLSLCLCWHIRSEDYSKVPKY